MGGHRISLISGAWSLAIALTACAGGGDRYPSLGIRDVERAEGMFDPVDPDARMTAPATPPAGQKTQLETLVAQAASAHRQFLDAAPGTRDLVSRIDRVSPESNAWADAQIALADLDSHRSKAAIALGDLDLLYANASTDFTEREAIDTARDQVIAWISEEDTILAELRAEADQ